MCYPKLFLSSHFELMCMWAECLLVYPWDLLSEMCAIHILHIIIIIILSMYITFGGQLHTNYTGQLHTYYIQTYFRYLADKVNNILLILVYELSNTYISIHALASGPAWFDGMFNVQLPQMIDHAYPGFLCGATARQDSLNARNVEGLVKCKGVCLVSHLNHNTFLTSARFLKCPSAVFISSQVIWGEVCCIIAKWASCVDSPWSSHGVKGMMS